MTVEPPIEPSNIENRLPAKDTFRILIMDNIENVELLKEACKKVGHSVIGAYTIAEAFAFLDGKNHADVIICAAYLEDESLFDFLTRLRKDPLHKQTMFMTLALAPGPMGRKINASTEKAGLAMGADVFLSMPVFDAEALIAEIKEILPPVPVLEQEKQDNQENS